MPLPKIATPKYELELPSTGETIQFRPFLVKEEKLLVIALESEDNKQISTAIKTVIKNCILTKGVKVESLPTFDIEYLFLNIRGKSVGEEIEVNIICPDDEETQVSVTTRHQYMVGQSHHRGRRKPSGRLRLRIDTDNAFLINCQRAILEHAVLWNNRNNPAAIDQ